MPYGEEGWSRRHSCRTNLRERRRVGLVGLVCLVGPILHICHSFLFRFLHLTNIGIRVGEIHQTHQTNCHPFLEAAISDVGKMKLPCLTAPCAGLPDRVG